MCSDLRSFLSHFVMMYCTYSGDCRFIGLDINGRLFNVFMDDICLEKSLKSHLILTRDSFNRIRIT